MAGAGRLPVRPPVRLQAFTHTRMIEGQVNPFREPLVHLTLYGPEGQPHEVKAVVDTGFNGTLTLPLSLIEALGLPFRRQGRAILGDGSETLFRVFAGSVDWFGERRRISVDEADTEPLAGMTLLYE